MNNERIKYLISKYTDGEETASERRELYLWFEELEGKPYDGISESTQDEVKAKLFASLRGGGSRASSRRLWLVSAAAAVLVLLTYFGVGRLISSREPTKSIVPVPSLAQIYPKQGGARVLFSNGREILVDSLLAGIPLEESGTRFVRQKDGSLDYGISTSEGMDNLYEDCIIFAPPSAQLHVMLPDGSKVTLQANSSLKCFVDSWTGKKRTVVLEGEAFFEVFKQGTKFVVETSRQKIEVLGTKFNVRSLPGADEVKTSLLEGTVRILPLDRDFETVTLTPGQQSVVRKGSITVKDVDVSSISEWTRGVFVFDGDNPKEVLRQIAQWYGVSISFKSDLHQIEYIGNVPNTLSLGQMVEMLNYAEIPTTVYRDDDGKIELVVE